MHHQQLLSDESAAADLQLLRSKAPKHPRLDEFSMSPRRHAEAILFELLAVVSRDEIVKNRLTLMNKEKKAEAPAPAPEAETEPAPEAEASAPAPKTEAKKKRKSTSPKKKSTQK